MLLKFCNLIGSEYFWPHPTKNFQITLYLPSIYISMQKTTLTDPITLEIWLIYEYCNLIGREHFHPCKTKNLQNHLLCFLNLHQYVKNQVQLSHITWDSVDSRILQSDLHRIFNLTQLKIHRPTWIHNYMPKSNRIINYFLKYIDDLRMLQSDWLRAFLTMYNLKFTNHPLHFFNLYLHAKNQGDSSFFSWDKTN